jgi:transporter family-2 protein
VDSLGPARAIMIIVVAQLLVAYCIELFGIFGVEKVSFEWRKLIGMALIIGGIITFKWK